MQYTYVQLILRSLNNIIHLFPKIYQVVPTIDIFKYIML